MCFVCVVKYHQNILEPRNLTIIQSVTFIMARVERARYGYFNQLSGHDRPVMSIKFSPNGQLIATGSDDTTVRLWNTSSGALQRIFFDHMRPVNDISWSADGYTLVSASDDKSLKLWDVHRGQPLTVYRGHEDSANACEINSSGTLICSISFDHTLRLWDTRTAICVLILEMENGPARCVTFNDEPNVVTGDDEGYINVWDIALMESTSKIDYSNSSITGIKYLNKQQRIISCLGKPIQLVTETSRPKIFSGHTNDEYTIKADYLVSPKGTYLVSGSEDHFTYIWNLYTRELTQKLVGHASPVVCVATHPTNDGIIATSAAYKYKENDYSVKLYKNI